MVVKTKKCVILSFVAILMSFSISLSLFSQYPPEEAKNPSDAKIKQWLCDIDETKDICKEYGGTTDSSKVPEDAATIIKKSSIRRMALRSLIQSDAGSEALMDYYLKEIDAKGASPHLLNVANYIKMYILKGLKQDISNESPSAKKAGSGDELPGLVFSKSEIKAYLISLSKFPKALEDIEDLGEVLTRSGQAELWQYWVRSVRPDENNAASVNAWFKSLEETCDPSGIEKARDILKKGEGYRNSYILDYLYKMGDASSFQYMLHALEGVNCNSGALSPLYVAGEADAKPVNDIMTCISASGKTEHHFHPENRSDLCRGIIRHILNDPNWVRWSNYVPMIRLGAQALADEEIIEQIKLAEKAGDLKRLSLWVTLLGSRDSVSGNDMLLRLAKDSNYKVDVQPNTVGPEPDITLSACRAIFTRLIGHNGSGLQRTIGQYPEPLRGNLVSRIIESSRLFPNFQSGPIIEDSGIGPPPDYKKSDLVLTKNDALILKYQDNLMRWITWTSNPDTLCSTYSIMTNSEAQKRFMEILKKRDKTAIKVVWTRSLNISPEVLRNMLDSDGIEEESELFLLLRLSEMGDQEAYSTLRNIFFNKIPDRFFAPVIDEIARQHDDGSLMKLLNMRSRTATPVQPSRIGLNNLITDRQSVTVAALLGRLVRVNPKAADTFIKNYDAPKLEDQILMLEAVKEARSANCEFILQRIEPLKNEWSSLSPRERESLNLNILWNNALRVTGTKWCKDQLLLNGDWRGLAELGDDRVGKVYIPSPDHPGCFDMFLAGNIREAIECRLKHSNVFSSRLVIEPLTGAVFNDRVYSKEMRSRLLDKFISIFPTLSGQEKTIALSLLPDRRDAWNNDVCRMLLKDQYGPVRLNALVRILKHPREGLEAEIQSIETNDPFPWCRRVAHEILLFQPDPLDPETGIKFTLP